MQLFIDSANIQEIRLINEMGCISGVTTNPTLVAKERRHYNQVLQEIASIVDGPISAEVLRADCQGMVEEARAYAALHENIVIKVPLTAEGLKAIKQLSAQGIRTNATLIFSANQALLAACSGASYVSPFLGRIDDISNEGMAVLQDIVEIFNYHMLPTQIIAASIRSAWQVVQSARMGAHIATVPYQILQQMLYHPLTDLGIERFNRDWQDAQKELASIERKKG